MQTALENNENTLILTASRRQSNYYSQMMSKLLAHNNNLWAVPQVYSLDDWASRSHHVLDELGETLIWQQSFEHLKSSKQWPNLANSDRHALCQDVSQAAYLCDHWNINSKSSEFKENENSFFFQQWHQEFQHLCRKINCRSRSQQLLHLSRKNTIESAPKNIIFIGFIEFTPAQQALIDTLKKTGCNVHTYQPQKKQKQLSCYGFQEAKDELHWIAKYSHDWYQKTGSEKGKSVMTIIVPDLASRWHEVFAKFNQAFHNCSNSRGSFSQPSRAFNLSGGIALTDMPLIDCACKLIKLKPESSFGELLPLLNHPALQLGVSQSQHEEIEELMSRGYRKNLEQAYQQFPEWHWLKPFASKSYWRSNDYPSRQLLKVSQRLKNAQWLEALKITSSEHQQHQQWIKKLQQVSKLDRFEQKISMQQAIQLLFSALGSLFQPRVEQARIQVLGLYEAIGLPSDTLWISGLTDQVLPKAPDPSTFIPVALQARQGIAESHPRTTLLYSKKLWQELLATAPEIITSYSRVDGDKENTVSSFIRHIKETPITISCNSEQQKATYSTSEKVNIATDATHYPSSLLEDQSACPFRAVLRHTVKAKSSSASDYYSHVDAGILIHTILDKISKDSAQKASSDIRQQASNSTRQQLQKKARLHPWLGNSQSGRQIHKQLEEQIGTWLERERDGRKNNAIIATEKDYHCTIGPLRCTFRIDRIDAVSYTDKHKYDGTLLIDYKTGSNTKAKNWQGQRPSNPQLLAYAIAVGKDNVSGISYVSLRPDYSSYIVYGNEQVKDTFSNPDIISSKKWLDSSKWHQWLDQQTQAVTDLAEEFAGGEVTLTPRDKGVCEYCDYKPVCRINQQQADCSDE